MHTLASVTNNHTQYQDDERKRRYDILKSLSVQDYNAAKERNRDRIPRTCEWFASHQRFRTWKDSASSSMLLVSADPGCGKSVLAKHLVNTVLPTTDTRTTCYFFFKDDFEDQKPARNALSCILHQLLVTRKQVFSDEILERFETSSQSMSSLHYLWDTLVAAANSQHAGEVVCILDAFDECKTEDQGPFARILRQFYAKSSSKASLKFLITSRPYTSILQGFQTPDGAKNTIIHLRGDDDEEVAKISREIDIFIDAEIEHVPDLSPEKQQLLLQAIRRVPNRTYLWVHLTLDWIKKEVGIRNSDINDIASHLPQKVDDAYEKILSRIPDSKRAEAEKLLHIIVAAARPLTLQEIDEAIAVEQHHRSHTELNLRGDYIDKYVRDICGLFVTIIDSRIYLLHQTAKEFLQPKDKGTATPDNLYQNNRKWKHSLQPQKSEGVLFQICAAYLLLSELRVSVPFEDVGMDSHNDSDEYVDEYVNKYVDKYVRKYPFLEYASTNWALHHRASDRQDISTPHSLICPDSKEVADVSTANLLWFRVHWSKKDSRCPVFFTPLMAAAYFGLESSVKLLLKVDKQQTRCASEPYDRTALSWASENGFDRIVRLLIPHPTRYRLKAALSLSSDSTVSGQDKDGMTPLHYAALNGHGKIVDLLVKAGANSNVGDRIGGTPLSYAFISQRHDIFQKLRKRTSEEDVRNTLADLLLSAVRRDNKSVVRQVLALETNNVTPNNVNLLSIAKSAEMLQLLIDAGADMEATDIKGNTSLHEAVFFERTKAVRVLLDKGADVKAVNKNGDTPLHIAASRWEAESTRALLDKGADVNAVNEDGDTPLHKAAVRENTEIVRALLDKGADMNAVNKAGETPKSILESRGLS